MQADSGYSLALACYDCFRHCKRAVGVHYPLLAILEKRNNRSSFAAVGSALRVAVVLCRCGRSDRLPVTQSTQESSAANRLQIALGASSVFYWKAETSSSGKSTSGAPSGISKLNSLASISSSAGTSEKSDSGALIVGASSFGTEHCSGCRPRNGSTVSTSLSPKVADFAYNEIHVHKQGQNSDCNGCGFPCFMVDAARLVNADCYRCHTEQHRQLCKRLACFGSSAVWSFVHGRTSSLFRRRHSVSLRAYQIPPEKRKKSSEQLVSSAVF